MVEGVFKLIDEWHRAPAKTRIVRCYQMIFVGQVGNQIAKHMRRAGKSVQQKNGRIGLVTGFSVENVLAFDFDCFKLDRVFVGCLSGHFLCLLCLFPGYLF